MEQKTIILDITDCKDLNDLHKRIKETFDFPEWYTGNWKCKIQYGTGALFDGVILRIGLSWLCGIVLKMGFYGFVLGYALAPYGCAIPGMIYFLSGIWRKRRVLAEDI